MASTDGLRIGRVSLGAMGTVIAGVLVVGASYAGQTASRIGNLEQQGSVNRSKIDGLQKQLDYMTSILEKLRDR